MDFHFCYHLFWGMCSILLSLYASVQYLQILTKFIITTIFNWCHVRIMILAFSFLVWITAFHLWMLPVSQNWILWTSCRERRWARVLHASTSWGQGKCTGKKKILRTPRGNPFFSSCKHLLLSFSGYIPGTFLCTIK